MLRIFSLIFSLLMAAICTAQTSYLNLISGQRLCGFSIAAAPNGDIGIVGTMLNGSEDAFFLKIPAEGRIRSRMLFGSGVDSFRDVVVGDDGNYYVAGFSSSFPGGLYDAIVLKISPRGTILWKKRIGVTDNNDTSLAIAKTTDGNFVAAGLYGQTAGAVLLFKFRSDGEVLWSQELDTPYADDAFALAPTSDGGIVVAASRIYPDRIHSDALLARVSENGSLLWSRAVRDVAFYNHESLAVAASSDGSILLGATLRGTSAIPQDHALLVKFSPTGSLIWSRRYPHNGGGTRLWDIEPLSDGSYVISGEDGQQDKAFLVFRIKKSGKMIWKRKYNSGMYDTALALAQTADGSILATGCVGSSQSTIDLAPHDLPLFKFQQNGLIEGGCSSFVKARGVSSARQPISVYDPELTVDVAHVSITNLDASTRKFTVQASNVCP